MLALLTWPAYGTWFAHPARGRVDDTARPVVPEPARRGVPAHLKWPPVRLEGDAHAVIVQDLQRIAALRGFELHAVVVAADHVHVLLDVARTVKVERLVQLIKGALSRALTVAAGDAPAASTRGGRLPHHKWWTRQYSFVPIDSAEEAARIVTELRARHPAGATVWTCES